MSDGLFAFSVDMEGDALKSASRIRVLAVGFSPEECERLGGLCTDAKFLDVDSVAQVDAFLRCVAPRKIDLVLVSTVDRGEGDVVLECLKLRDHHALSDVPLLAEVSRHQMDLGHHVCLIRGSDFVVQPIDRLQLSEKMRELGLERPTE